MDEKEAQFRVLANGSLEITGNFELFDANGEIITRQSPVFLCRCGKSADKPFCDGSHRKTGFRG